MSDRELPRNRSPTPQWWYRRSLRARLTVAAVAVIAVGMGAAAALLLWRMHSVLAGNLDTSLTQQIHAAAEDIAAGSMPPRVWKTAGASSALQVVDGAGRVTASAGDVDGASRMFFTTPAVGDPAIATVSNPGLEAPYRVAAMSVTTRTGPVKLYIGSPTTTLATMRAALGSALIVGIPALVALLALVSWWLLGRALRPVETMRRQAAAIPGDDLRRRLDVSAAKDELGRLSETFNELLERIAVASDRQRRFVDDAAHELRSPLAALQTRLEIGLRHPTAGIVDSEERAYGQRQALKEITRLVDLVNDLLSLARADAGRRPRSRPIDLDDLVWRAATDAREHGPPKIDTTGIAPVRVVGDTAGLRRVVQNLLDNARRHANDTVTVQLRLNFEPPSSGGDSAAVPTATLIVADDGPGIPVADRQRVFDRFVRLDECRPRDSGGTGLGLAIVSAIVAEHGGRVWIDGGEAGTAFVVQLPAVPSELGGAMKAAAPQQNRSESTDPM